MVNTQPVSVPIENVGSRVRRLSFCAPLLGRWKRAPDHSISQAFLPPEVEEERLSETESFRKEAERRRNRKGWICQDEGSSWRWTRAHPHPTEPSLHTGVCNTCCCSTNPQGGWSSVPFPRNMPSSCQGKPLQGKCVFGLFLQTHLFFKEEADTKKIT